MTKALPPKALDSKTARLRAARLAKESQRPKPIPSNEHHRVFGLNDEIPFGKYKGTTIEELVDSHIDYVTWLLEETQFELTIDAEREYLARLDVRKS